jgi:hypothetical protein
VKIPRRVSLLGYRFDVRYVSKEEWKDADDWGESSIERREILILEGLDATVAAHTYFHELLHLALDLLGYDAISENEQLVDSVSALIHQAHISAEHEDE